MSREHHASHGAPLEVGICAHGCVHLRFGAATIHLTQQEFASFMRTAQHALHTLQTGGGRGGDATVTGWRN